MGRPSLPVLSRSLHWVHWFVLGLSLVVTMAAWRFSVRQAHEKVEARFHREADQVVEQISERMDKYADALWGGVGAIQAKSGSVNHSEWLRFAETLQLESKYPGINGIGVIHRVDADDVTSYLEEQRQQRPSFRIFPAHPQPMRLPITFIEPVTHNQQAVGLDIAHEANRYQAALKARDTGNAQITGPIVLVQDAERTPGFLFYVPFYEGGTHQALSARRRYFKGMVYAPFVVHKLLEGALAKQRRHVGIRIQDSGETIYDEHLPSVSDFDRDPLFTRNQTVSMYGRVWHFDIRSSRDFREAQSDEQPMVILGLGITIDLLLLGVFLVLSQGNQRLAQEVRERRAAEQGLRVAQQELEARVEQRTLELTRSNADLKSFAYAASHDLRAPVSAIQRLSSWLAEEESQKLSEEGRELLNQLSVRANRLNMLMDAILAHHNLGRGQEPSKLVDLNDLIHEVLDTVAPDGNFSLETGELPSIVTQRGALQLVVQNLVQNAVRHHDQGSGTVLFWAKQVEGCWEFCVADDGPGIEGRFHDRVLQPFQKLKPRDEVEGSGMGLALVKRQVELVGGRLWLESEGRGTKVFFTWPMTRTDSRAA